jgi:hypothetical protein
MAYRLARASVQAYRIAGALAAQPVLPTVYPQRAGTQYRARGRAFGRLTGDDRDHIAIAFLAGVARRQYHKPRLVGRVLLDRDPDGPVPVEMHQAPPAFRRGSELPQFAGQATERQPRGGTRVMRVVRVRCGAQGASRPRGDKQDGFGEPGDLRGNRHVCGQRTILRGRALGTGPERAVPTTTVSWGRCQQQHEGQSTHVIITATPEW